MQIGRIGYPRDCVRRMCWKNQTPGTRDRRQRNWRTSSSSWRAKSSSCNVDEGLELWKPFAANDCFCYLVPRNWIGITERCRWEREGPFVCFLVTQGLELYRLDWHHKIDVCRNLYRGPAFQVVTPDRKSPRRSSLAFCWEESRRAW